MTNIDDEEEARLEREEQARLTRLTATPGIEEVSEADASLGDHPVSAAGGSLEEPIAVAPSLQDPIPPNAPILQSVEYDTCSTCTVESDGRERDTVRPKTTAEHTQDASADTARDRPDKGRRHRRRRTAKEPRHDSHHRRSASYRKPDSSTHVRDKPHRSSRGYPETDGDETERDKSDRHRHRSVHHPAARDTAEPTSSARRGRTRREDETRRQSSRRERTAPSQGFGTAAVIALGGVLGCLFSGLSTVRTPSPLPKRRRRRRSSKTAETGESQRTAERGGAFD